MELRITLVVTDELDPGESWSELMETISDEEAKKAMLHVRGYALGGRIESWKVN